MSNFCSARCDKFKYSHPNGVSIDKDICDSCGKLLITISAPPLPPHTSSTLPSNLPKSTDKYLTTTKVKKERVADEAGIQSENPTRLTRPPIQPESEAAVTPSVKSKPSSEPNTEKPVEDPPDSKVEVIVIQEERYEGQSEEKEKTTQPEIGVKRKHSKQSEDGTDKVKDEPTENQATVPSSGGPAKKSKSGDDNSDIHHPVDRDKMITRSQSLLANRGDILGDESGCTEHSKCFIIRFTTAILEDLYKGIRQVLICIGLPTDENFKNYYSVNFQESKVSLDDHEFVLLSGDLFLSPELISLNSTVYFSYKYVLVNLDNKRVLEEVSDSYNRFFTHRIKSKCFAGEIIKKFDSIILPPNLDKSSSNFVSWVKAMFRKNPDSFPFIDIPERLLASLKMFLPSFCGLGKSPSLQCDTIEEFVDHLHYIIYQLSTKFLLSEHYKHEHAVKIWMSREYLLKLWLEYIFQYPINPNDEESFIRICTLLYILSKNKGCMNLESKIISFLLSFCERDCVVSKINTFLKEEIETLNEIEGFFTQFVFNETKVKREYLKLIPLYHHICFPLYKGLCLPLVSNDIHAIRCWGFPESFYSFNILNIDNNYLDELLVSSSSDPLLPYSLILLTLSEKNLPNFISCNQLPISAYLAVVLKRFNASKSDQVSLRCKVYEYLITCFKSENVKVDLNTLIPLTFELFSNLRKCQNLNEKEYQLIIELISHELCASESFSSDELARLGVLKDSELADLPPFWLKKGVYGKKKLEYWNLFFGLKFPENYNFTSALGEQLSRIINSLRLDDYLEIFLYCSEYTTNICLEIHNIIRSNLMSRVLESNDHQRQIIVNKLQTTKNFPGDKDIFSKILLEEKSNFEKDPYVHLFNWICWNNFFRFFVQGNLNEIIQEEAEMFLLIVSECFITLIRSILDRSILVKDLNCCNGRKQEFYKILEIFSKSCHFKENKFSIKSIKCSLDESVSSLNQLDLCLARFQHLKSIPKSVFTALNFQFPCTKIEMRMMDLCGIKDNQFEIYYSSDFNLLIRSDKFVLITDSIKHLQHSHIFQDIYGQNFEMHSGKAEEFALNLDLFNDLVWSPTMTMIREFYESVLSNEIELIHVRKYFETRDVNEIHKSLNMLLEGVLSFEGQNTKKRPSSDARKCAETIHRYFTLHDCTQTAELISQIALRYEFGGDFKTVERLVRVSTQLKDETLKVISEDMCNVGKSLKVFSDSHREGLESFLRCHEFINWVKSNLSNLVELKMFVDLSTSNCGDNPIVLFTITTLHTVCTSFAPLIYDVKSNAGYHEFLRKCKMVNLSIDKNPKLPGMLREVANRLSLWEGLKHSHGSFEKSAIKQLHTLCDNGMFQVLNSDHVIAVSACIQEESAAITQYNMEQLKDLHSKLNLVVGRNSSTDSTTDNSVLNSIDTVRLFSQLLEKLTILAETLTKLSECGNFKYLKYKFQLTLKENDRLEDEMKQTENDLRIWKDSLEETRDKYYFLNYFTTKQLALLRKGIHSFTKNEFKSKDVEQLNHLLSLLNNELKREDIIRALKSAEIVQEASFPSKQSHSLSPFAYKKVFKAKSKTPTISKANTGEDKIPDEFTKNEKELVENIHQDCGLPLEVVIRGIRALKAEHGTVVEQNLVQWCLENNQGGENDDSMDVTPVKDPRPLSSVTIANRYNSGNIFRSGADLTDLHQLGEFLKCLHMHAPLCSRKERVLPPTMKESQPNLVLVPNCSLYSYVIHLYSLEDVQLLPSYHEVLICTALTEIEEIEIFWRRALLKSDVNDRCIFCLVSIENLRYEVAVHSANLFWNFKQKFDSSSNYKLVLICSEELEEQSYMAAAFENFKIPILFTPKLKDVNAYLLERFKSHNFLASRVYDPVWFVDAARSRVRLVVSESVGAGKSLYVSNLVSNMLSDGVVSEKEREEAAVTVALHGKQASEEQLTTELLRKHVSSAEHGFLFHVDINSTVQLGLEPILFKLLVLGSICKGTGELWHCRPQDYYVLEMTVDTTVQTSLANFISLFPKSECTQPYQFDKHTTSRFQENKLKELKQEPFQRVALYLSMLDTGGDMDTISFDIHDSQMRIHRNQALKIILKYCDVPNPSWAEVRNFVSFLNRQLEDCEHSHYCIPGLMGNDWKGFKSFVVRFMITMSRDFATSFSVSEPDTAGSSILERYEIAKKRRWEENCHPYIFFNPDKQTMTFLGFHISEVGHLIDPDRPGVIIQNSIMPQHLIALLTQNKVDLRENYYTLDKYAKLWKIAKVMGIEWLSDPDPGYVLTLDNVRKILAILMRFRCNIPVVIMGETGCGKTRLIQYMCDLQGPLTGERNMLILKVHGGTTEEDVKVKVKEAEELAASNWREHNIDTVLFFDEANTSPAIGLIKEIMCDKRMYGRKIRTDIGLQFIAACNPYRKHSTEMLKKLSSAGLGFFTEASKTTDRLGDIPLRELVYRVMELPASLRPLVWDFGQLSNTIERTYTREIVDKHLKDRNSPIAAGHDVVDAITEVLASAQNYMRTRKDECSFVSLRDIERAMRVLIWFYRNRNYLFPRKATKTTELVDSPQHSVLPSSSKHVSKHRSHPYPPHHSSKHRSPSKSSNILTGKIHTPNKHSSVIPSISSEHSHTSWIKDTSKSYHFSHDLTDCLILALAVCYRAKLEIRREFDEFIFSKFLPPLSPLNDPKEIHILVNECQENVINSMVVGEHIAKNIALKENVFMMFVCIELKIPLFVIGKPGSSKSLAKTIISNNMLGESCPDNSILKNFKEVQIMSYQCSQLSTADGIIGVFRNCRSFQRGKDSNKFVSCVVLDEVGLAEDSPQLPLKVLHPLLEDGNYIAEESHSEFGGDSNCSADPHASPSDAIRAVENGNDNSRVAFIGISNWALDPAKMNRGIMVSRSDPDISELVSSAKGILRNGESLFHTSLINSIPELAKAYKKLSSTCPNYTKSNDNTASKHYFGLRDFYSLIKMLAFLCDSFKSQITYRILEHAILRNFGGITHINPVEFFNKTLILPENIDQKGPDCSPLDLIEANLSNFNRTFHGETRYLLLLTENYAALDILLNSERMWPKNDTSNVSVIFGSSFPQDKEYSTVCRNINKIKICMESGKKVILLNLENLYESLYDALNQYYMEIFGQRWVDLGLGTHRMKSRVHEDFKLIVIANTETVYAKFPTPLINRLEKHFLTMSSILSDQGKGISSQLAEWARNFSTIVNPPAIGLKNHIFSEGDCFIGYHSDTPCSIVFQVIKEMYPYVAEADLDSCLDTQAVLERSQTILLKMATIDAVLRLKGSQLTQYYEPFLNEYFKLHLGSLEEYLRHALETICENKKPHLTLATTYSRLLTDRDVLQLKELLCHNFDYIKCLSLQQFQTEQQFSKEIQKFLLVESQTDRVKQSDKIVLLVQSDKGADNSKLIACTRYKIIEELKEWEEQKNLLEYQVYVIFLVQLKREVCGSQFASYCGRDWTSVHIDDICPLDCQELPPISNLFGTQIHDLFARVQEDEMVSIQVIY